MDVFLIQDWVEEVSVRRILSIYLPDEARSLRMWEGSVATGGRRKNRGVEEENLEHTPRYKQEGNDSYNVGRGKKQENNVWEGEEESILRVTPAQAGVHMRIDG